MYKRGVAYLYFMLTIGTNDCFRQPEWLDLFQEYGNAFFVALFTLEMLVKMYSLGLQVSAILSFSVLLLVLINHNHTLLNKA